MKKKVYRFSAKKVSCYFKAEFKTIGKLVDKQHSVIITDENVFRHHSDKFQGFKTIVLKPGESFKVQTTIDSVIEQLIAFSADRNTFLLGVGGGVVTDITGYVASIYMRGIEVGFVPTTLLAMVDASIGGKNGIDVGVYKNLVGTIRQPSFLFYDIYFLNSLPLDEWINGFAEIIKHACIADRSMFTALTKNNVETYKENHGLLEKLIRRNVEFKSSIVQDDEFEKNTRRLLNFGHTVGHAIENTYKLPHGHAVSIGMVAACRFSEQLIGFKDTEKIVDLLRRYGLPVQTGFDGKRIFEVLSMDKKREMETIRYVLLKKIGKATITPIALTELETMLNKL